MRKKESPREAPLEAMRTARAGRGSEQLEDMPEYMNEGDTEVSATMGEEMGPGRETWERRGQGKTRRKKKRRVEGTPVKKTRKKKKQEKRREQG